MYTNDSNISTSEDNHKEGTAQRKKAVKKRKRTLNEKEGSEKGRTSGTEEEEEGVELEIDRELDQALETKSKQHNLTTVNVKNIIHVSSHNSPFII